MLSTGESDGYIIGMMRRKHWYDSRLLVIMLLFLVWPIGVYGILRCRQFRFSSRMLLILLGTAALGAIFLPVWQRYHLPTGGAAQPVALGAPATGSAGFLQGFVASAPDLLAEASSNCRLCRYRVDYGIDKEPPSSITISNSSDRTTRTIVVRVNSTKNIGSGWLSLGGVVHILYIAVLVLWGLVVVVILGDNEFSGIGKFGLFLCVFFIGLCIASIPGYLSGSRLVIDNATAQTLTVRLGAWETFDLPPSSYRIERVIGSWKNVQVIADGRTVESGKLVFDSSWKQGIERALFGQGTYIYNIGAANSYSVDTIHYGLIP
jgi:hypothetical protein